MKIKKHLVAAALAVGLAGSAAGMGTEANVAPQAAVGVILAFAATGMPEEPSDLLVHAGATGAGGAAGGLAMIGVGALIGGSFGAFVGGPVGIIAGSAAGAM